MQEPHISALSGPEFARVFKRAFLATRPMFFPASVMPVLVGTAWGSMSAGRFDAIAFVMALLAMVLVHGGVNVLNDVYDDIGGTDGLNTGRIYPFTGGSRFIQNDVMSRAAMKRLGIGLIVAACGPGAVLVASHGGTVLAMGVTGIAIGVLYSATPVFLAGRGVGELAVAVGFGVLPVMGSAWLQSGVFDSLGFVLSLAVALWIAMILLVNEVPDREADRAGGKHTLAVRLGTQAVSRVYVTAHVIAALAIVYVVWRTGLPPWALVGPVALLVLAGRAAMAIARHPAPPEDYLPAIKITLTIHAAGSLWLAGWILFGLDP